MSARGPDAAPAQRARTLAAAAIRRPPSRGAERAAAKTGAPRGGVRGTQRTRLLTAATDIVAEQGYAQLTVTRVVARAGVSRETFYELFADREELLLAAFDDAVARIGATLERECSGETTWQERVRAGLETVLVVLDEQPALTRLCVVEAPQAGTRVLGRRAEILDEARADRRAGPRGRARQRPPAADRPQPRGGRRLGGAAAPADPGHGAPCGAGGTAGEHDRVPLPRPRGGDPRARAPGAEHPAAREALTDRPHDHTRRSARVLGEPAGHGGATRP